MTNNIISAIAGLIGIVGLFTYILKGLDKKIDKVGNKKLDTQVFNEHLKSFENLRTEVKDVKLDIKHVGTNLNANTEMLIRLDEHMRNGR